MIELVKDVCKEESSHETLLETRDQICQRFLADILQRIEAVAYFSTVLLCYLTPQ